MHLQRASMVPIVSAPPCTLGPSNATVHPCLSMSQNYACEIWKFRLRSSNVAPYRLVYVYCRFIEVCSHHHYTLWTFSHLKRPGPVCPLRSSAHFVFCWLHTPGKHFVLCVSVPKLVPWRLMFLIQFLSSLLFPCFTWQINPLLRLNTCAIYPLNFKCLFFDPQVTLIILYLADCGLNSWDISGLYYIVPYLLHRAESFLRS